MGKKNKRKQKQADSDLSPPPKKPEPAPSLAHAAFVATDPLAFVPGAARASDPPIVKAPAPTALSTNEVPTANTTPEDALNSKERVPPASASTIPERLVAGVDVDADNAADIAPIGPTEPGLSAGFGQDAEDPQAAERFGVETKRTTAARTPSAEDIEQQIRDLEARLDGMFGKGRDPLDKPATQTPADKPSSPAIAPPRPSTPGQATAHEVLSPEFYAQQWGRAGLRSRSEEVDEFGLDPVFEQRLLPTLDFLHDRYFRVQMEGAEHIPTDGRCLLVANHSGGPLPYDGLMLRTAVRRGHPTQRELRWLAEDFIYYLPFVGTFMNRLGAVRACQENAERLLNKGALVAVFPEGAKGIGKLYRDRYKLQRFGRGGFIRLCLRTRTPIVPCAIVGAEEANPMLYRIEYMTKALGIPYFPITPTFPALGAFGLMPAPTKWKIRFGEPFTWSGYGPESADDEILVGRLSERVRASIQTMLEQMVTTRRSVWFG